MPSPISIRDLVPLDISGRHSRKGFSYQDNIAAAFCISFINNTNLKEIWLETHDDILLFWEDSGVTTIEFVQVKATSPTSRWSVSSITGNTNPADSIVKKLMEQDRGSEAVLFRIISSFDVAPDLTVLRNAINSILRKSETAKEIELGNAIIKKHPDLKTPNGKSIQDWVKLCWWEKKADNKEDLESSNKLALETALSTFGKPIQSDQRDEIYQKIQLWCYKAATEDMQSNPECYKIIREPFVTWLSTTIDSLYTPSAGMAKLEEKLRKAKNVPPDYIEGAKLLKWDYTKNRLNNDFIQPSEMSSLESVIHGELYKMKIALDNDEIDEEQFHKSCTDKLNEIKNNTVFKDKNIPDYLLSGYMYKLASECLHRFTKVEL